MQLTATVTNENQIAIPRELLAELQLKPGQSVALEICGGHLEVYPIRPLTDFIGIAQGIPNDFERDPDCDRRTA